MILDSLSGDKNVGILTVDIETDLFSLCAVGAGRHASIALPCLLSAARGLKLETREGG